MLTQTSSRTPAVLTAAFYSRAAAAGPGTGRRLTGRLAPALVYLSGQALTVLVVVLVAVARHRLAPALLWSWDGRHFLSIAHHGYTHSAAAHVDRSPAFFPGYPALLAAVSAVFRLPLATAAIAVSLAGGVVLSYGLVRLVSQVAGPDPWLGRLVVAAASTGPLSIVLSMAYSESLFCALAVWSLVALGENRWLSASALCIGAGLVRQTALALVVALLIAAGVAAAQRVATWRTAAAAALAPTGLLGYLGYVAATTGHLTGWFQAERNGWNTQFDFGRSTGRFVYRALVAAPSVLDVATVAVLVVATALVAALAIMRASAPVIAYTTVVLLIDVGSDGIMNSKFRLLLPAFTLLIPFAVWLRSQRRAALFTLVALFAFVGAWYSAYALLIYGYAM